jgi:hypothetical protein
MEPAYRLRPNALDWFAPRNPRWRHRDGSPHLTNIAFAANLTLSKTIRGDQPLSSKVQAHLVALAMFHGMTEAEARAEFFELTGEPGQIEPMVAA